MVKRINIGKAFKELGCIFEIPDIIVSGPDDDGAFMLEWIFPKARIGLTVGPKADDHGWYVVSKETTASGPLTLNRA